MNAPDWLVAQPIAHRGLHDASAGILENSATAAACAVARNFAIECDVQRTADGEAVVFHDFMLERLTAVLGVVAERTAAALGALALRGTADTITTLPAFLGAIGGRVPVIIEVKSAFDGDLRLAERVADIVAGAGGRLALKSFDPDVIAHLRMHEGLARASVPLGIVAQASYMDDEQPGLTAERLRELDEFLHFDRTRPDFVSYRCLDLPHAVPFLCRGALGRPVMTWTVRSPEQKAHGLRWADQIVFEGFDPAA